MLNISQLKVKEINEEWLFDFISIEFPKSEENITSLKILSKLGISIHDQHRQLQYKNFTQKFNHILEILKEKEKLVLKGNFHDTLGIKEKAYKLVKK